MTPESAVQKFIDSKKNQTEVSEEVFETLRDFEKWEENSLIGLLNASAYYPDIYIVEDMEKKILARLEHFKKRIVPVNFS
ncbi:MAG: hypothetical protein H7A24_11415 [Leptospiraceae bacterium]|nr:hypothetical protein [Leptospiraceae bacterium]MCP5512482.1 hypothetical protein [Leptospiraceae bacterium]